MARFISRLDFAKEVGISLSSLHRRVKENKWPFNAYIVVGNRILYPASLLDQMEALAPKRPEDERPRV